MSRRYLKPPLVEAVCNIHFSSNEWDWTIPGLIYQKIQADFPKKREVKKVEFEFNPENIPSQPPIVQPAALHLLQFRREDETALVQVGLNTLVVNYLTPYPGWTSYRPLIQQMLDTYWDVAKPQQIIRVGLRFINRIEFSSPGINLDTYFNFKPTIPAEIPQSFQNLFMRMEIPHAENRLLIMIFGTTPDIKLDKPTFVLDLDHVTAPSSGAKYDEVVETIETAHDEIEKAFEASITDDLRAMFEEVR